MTFWLRVLIACLLVIIIAGLLIIDIRLANVEDQQKKDHQLLCYIADATGVDSPSDGSPQICKGIKL